MNPALSNRPWTNQEGTGKRDYLLEHSALKLNAKVVADHPNAWAEEEIRVRTAALTERLLALWPRPAGVAAVPFAEVQVDPLPAAGADEQFPDDEDPNIAPHTGRYRLLYWWLKAQDADELPLDFEQVEQIAGVSLPPSARLHPAHWYSYEGSAVARAIRDAGWNASRVSLSAQSLTFIRTTPGES